MIKNLLIAGVVLLTANIANAMDISETLALNTEVKAAHKIDAESTKVTINPELVWTPGMHWSMTAGTTITGWDSTLDDRFILFDSVEDGSRPDLELGAYYTVNGGVELYGETKWDMNAGERKEIEVGVTYSF
tara:strand:+ start:145 stop:540 length:396 start_codon:yes stop_codon:yes gene_type:complete